MPSELPRSKEALVFACGANASALPLFPAGGETDWRIRSTSPQDFVFRGYQGRTTLKRTSGDPGVMAGGAIHPSSACAFPNAAPFPWG
jgi:hypothetical protein